MSALRLVVAAVLIQTLLWASVASANQAPTASILDISPSPAYHGENVTCTGNGTDIDGNVTTFVWSSNIDGEFYNGTQNTTTFANLSTGNHTISLIVQDDNGSWSDVNSTTLEVKQNDNGSANIPPNSSIVSISPTPAFDDDVVTFEGNGTDPDSSVVRYVWSSSIDGEFHNGSENSTTTDTLSVGNHTISFRCQDDDGAWSDWDMETLRVRNAPGGENAPPTAEIASIDPDPAVSGQTITFEASAVDVDGSVESFIWTSDRMGSELYNGPNSTFSRSDLKVGTHEITLIVIDDDGDFSDPATSVIEVTEEAEPPTDGEPDEETEGITAQIVDFLTGVLQDPLMLGLVLTTVFVVIGAIAATVSRKKKQKVEEARRVAEEEARRRGPPPDERIYRPPPGWTPEGDRRGPPSGEDHGRYDPHHDRLPGHAPPPQDADIEWTTEPVGGPPRGDHAEHFYDRERYGRPRDRMERRDGEWEARGYERGTGPMDRPRSPYERPRGPGHEMYARPRPRRREPEPEPEEEEEEDDALIYDRGGKGYKAMTAPVELPEEDAGPKCPECDEPLEDSDARFCSNCGTYLR